MHLLWLVCSFVGLAGAPSPSTWVSATPWCPNSLRLRVGPSMDASLQSLIPEGLLPSCLRPHAQPLQGWAGPVPAVTNTTGPAMVSGNLVGQFQDGPSILFTRRTDGARLLTATFTLSPPTQSAPSSGLPPDFSIAVDIIAHQKSRVYGLGQIENVTATSGCDRDPRAYPLARNGGTFALGISKFHVSLPFVYSTGGFGFVLNAPGEGSVTVHPNGSMRWVATSQPQIDCWVSGIGAGTPVLHGHRDVYRQYADATGHAPVLPPHAARFWQSRLRYRTQAEVEGVAARFGALNVSLGSLVIDFCNQRVDGDFEMDPRCFPDPRAMADAVRRTSGAELMVSLWPTVAPAARAFPALNAHGCVARGVVDPSSAACRALLWEAYLKPRYVDAGIRDFWLDETDFAHPVRTCGPARRCGRLWVDYWTRTFADPMRALGLPSVLLVRGAWLGAQRLGVVLWSSDIQSTFEELRAQVPEGVHASLSGVPWWTTDVGGFGCPESGRPNHDPYMRELVVRWYQFGALCPVFRTHGCRRGTVLPPLPPGSPCAARGQGDAQGTCGENELWAYGADVQAVLTRYVRLRNDVLAPYVRELAANVTRFGVPTMRPLWYEFPEDEACWAVEDQFLLGPRYLVAPVVTLGARQRAVYFPAGAKWADWEDGGQIEGGQWRTVSAPLEKLPLYIRS